MIDPVKQLVSYSVTATFTAERPNEFPLAVSVNGKGRVTSEPSRIDCGPTCSALFPTDSAVTLTATPIPGWSFAEWGGACSGSGACTVTMSAPLSVTATFAPPETAYALAVSVEGAGSVTSDIEGISCGSSCYVVVRDRRHGHADRRWILASRGEARARAVALPAPCP